MSDSEHSTLLVRIAVCSALQLAIYDLDPERYQAARNHINDLTRLVGGADEMPAREAARWPGSRPHRMQPDHDPEGVLASPTLAAGIRPRTAGPGVMPQTGRSRDSGSAREHARDVSTVRETTPDGTLTIELDSLRAGIEADGWVVDGHGDQTWQDHYRPQAG